jgi:osmotically-inducible protein OsmY
MIAKQKTENDSRRMHPSRESELAHKVEMQIAGLAQGRIRDLEVTCLEGKIILKGRSRTQHAKQIAHEAALCVSKGRANLENQIVVNS